MPTYSPRPDTFHAPRLLWSASPPAAQGWTCRTASFAAMGTACAFHIHGSEPKDNLDAAMAALSTIGMLKELAELGVSHLWQDENGRIGGTLGPG